LADAINSVPTGTNAFDRTKIYTMQCFNASYCYCSTGLLLIGGADCYPWIMLISEPTLNSSASPNGWYVGCYQSTIGLVAATSITIVCMQP
jgi:hypothetical protein